MRKYNTPTRIKADNSGYRPDVAYSKLLVPSKSGDTIVLYFNENKEFIGTGHSSDKVSFKYIENEGRRTNKDQVVDEKKARARMQDEGKLVIVPK